MGNQTGKDETGSIVQEKGNLKSDDQRGKLEKHYEEIISLTNSCGERTGLNVTEFKSLFRLNEHFGELLFLKCMNQSRVNPCVDSVMSRDHFITSVTKILELASLQEQIDFYLGTFASNEASLSVQEFIEILNTCYALELNKINTGVLDLNSAVLKSMEKSLFSSADTVEKGDYIYWMGRHCSHLMHGIHSYVCSALCSSGRNQEVATSMSESLQCVLDNHYLMSLTVLWAMNTHIPASYTASIDIQATWTNLAQSISLGDIVGPGGWQMLYDCNTQGFSLNRFEHHVMSYAAATITLIQFEGHLYCIGADTEWVDKTDRWGGQDCFLLQILPQYRIIQAGPCMLYLNTQDRKSPKGIFIGKDSRSTMLQIDTDFAKVKHYGIDVPLQRIEVWGCGRRSMYEAQLQQRKWETQEAERHKNRKLKIEDWKDNPDRQLLELGGVTTEHAER